MAGFIEISSVRKWSSANWVFFSVMDGVLEDISRRGDEEMLLDVEQSKWMQTFSLADLLDDERKEVLVTSLMRVCDLVEKEKLIAKVDGKSLDIASQIEFKSEVRRLADELRDCFGSS